MTASAVACAPATFDGLTGGQEKKEQEANTHAGEIVIDPELTPPRPISPISVSWVNTSRPKFRWELSGKATGAIIEASQTRDFTGEIRTFSANGDEYTLEEDLAPGMWFWRLRGRIAPSEASGNLQEFQGPPPTDKTPATVWQVLVRGPGPSGASDVANGGIFDLNGDGIPDLATTALVTPAFFPPEDGAPAPTKNTPIVLQWLGQPDGTYQFFSDELIFDVSHQNVSLAGGVDVDGDGYTDFASASVWDEPEAPGGLYSEALIFHGGPGGMDSEKDGYQGGIIAPWFTKVPRVQAAGDVNGDGYGDLAMSFPDLSYAALGSHLMGASTMMVFPTAGDGPASTLSPALLASWDFDNDGKSDIAFTSTRSSTPLAYTRGSSDKFETLGGVPPGDVTPTSAIAIASGDVDGNGKNEFVFTTTIGGLPAVCLYAFESGPLNRDRCWIGEGSAKDFGKSIVSADIDGDDGKDELLVATATGVMMLKYLQPGFEASPIAGTFRSSITVLHPGRPGPARWAIIGGDGKSISIFNGLTVAQKLDVSADPKVVELGPSIR